jgi:hypothetical protein
MFRYPGGGQFSFLVSPNIYTNKIVPFSNFLELKNVILTNDNLLGQEKGIKIEGDSLYIYTNGTWRLVGSGTIGMGLRTIYETGTYADCIFNIQTNKPWVFKSNEPSSLMTFGPDEDHLFTIYSNSYFRHTAYKNKILYFDGLGHSAPKSIGIQPGDVADGAHNHTLASLSERSYNSLTNLPILHDHTNKTVLDQIVTYHEHSNKSVLDQIVTYHEHSNKSVLDQIVTYHEHSNKPLLDNINQNLSITSFPTFSNLNLSYSLQFIDLKFGKDEYGDYNFTLDDNKIIKFVNKITSTNICIVSTNPNRFALSYLNQPGVVINDVGGALLSEVKKTGFNLNIGTSSGTVASGDHDHGNIYLPNIGNSSPGDMLYFNSENKLVKLPKSTKDNHVLTSIGSFPMWMAPQQGALDTWDLLLGRTQVMNLTTPFEMRSDHVRYGYIRFGSDFNSPNESYPYIHFKSSESVESGKLFVHTYYGRAALTFSVENKGFNGVTFLKTCMILPRTPIEAVKQSIDYIDENGLFVDPTDASLFYKGQNNGFHRLVTSWYGTIGGILQTFNWIGDGPLGNYDGIILSSDHDSNPNPFTIQVDCTGFPTIWCSKNKKDTNYQNLIIGYPNSGKGIITEYLKLNNFNANSILSTNSNSEVVATSNINIDSINEYTLNSGVTIEGVHFSDGDLYISGDNMIVMNYVDYATQQNLMKLGTFDIYRNANTSDLNFQCTDTQGVGYFKWIKHNGSKILGLSMNDELGINSVLETNSDKNIVSFAKKTAFNKDFGTISGTIAEGNHEHVSILCNDTRNVYNLPGDYSNHLYFEMKDTGVLNGGSPSLYWAGVLTFSHWNDDTGGPRLQFSYTNDYVTMRTGTIASGWNSWKQIAYSGHSHTLASLSEKSYNSLTDKPDLNPIYSLMHTGVLNFNGLSINTDTTKFNVGSGEGYYVNRLNPLNPTIKKVVWNEFLAQSTPYLLTNTSTYVGLRVDVETPYLVYSNYDFSTNELLYIIKLGRLSHFGKTVITATYNYILKYNSDWDNSMFIHKYGTINLNGNVFYANGNNLKLNKTSGVFQRLGANFNTDKQNYSIVNSSSYSQISFNRVYLTADKSSIVIGPSTTDLDPANYDNNGVLTALPSQNPYSIQLVIMYPNNSTYTMFILYSQTAYSNLTAARNALDTLQFTINSDLFGGNLRAILILERTVTDLQTAISNGTAFIVDGSSLGLSVGSGTSSSGGISGYHNTLPDLQGGSANSYYHSNQSINTTDNVTFKGMTLRDIQGNNIPLQLNLFDDWAGQNTSGNDVLTCKINLGSEGCPNAIQTNIPNGGWGDEQRLDFATTNASNDPTQIVRMSIMPFTGRIGIGTKSPESLLHVNGTTTLPQIKITGLSSSSIVETDSNKYLVSIPKNSAYNKNFGNSSNTISEGNHEHNSIVCEDSRDVLNMPGYYVKHLYHQLKDIGVLNGGSPSLAWTNVLTLSHWDDDTAGPRLQFSYLGDQFCLRTGTIASGWNSWKYFSCTDHNHTLSSLSEKSYNSLTDKPDLSSLHIHSNKTDLDSINQNLSNTSNVSFNSILANNATIDSITEKTQGYGVRLYNSKFYNNFTYLTNTVLNLDYSDWSSITNELIIGTNSLVRFAGSNDLTIRTNQSNSYVKFSNNNNQTALSINTSTNYKEKILEVDSNSNLITIEKNTAYNKNFGNTSNTVAEGNHDHTTIVCEDSRNVYNLPGDYSDRLYFQIKDQGVLNGGSPNYIFAGVLTFSHWYDDTAGPRLQFSYANNSVTMRTGTIADGWNSWKQISYTDHNHTLASLSEKSYNSLTDKPNLHEHSNKAQLDLINQDLSTSTGTPYWNELSTAWLTSFNTANLKNINVDNKIKLNYSGITGINASDNVNIYANTGSSGVVNIENISFKLNELASPFIDIKSSIGDISIKNNTGSNYSNVNLNNSIYVRQDKIINLPEVPISAYVYSLGLDLNNNLVKVVSSKKYKENIDYNLKTNNILNLSPCYFNYKSNEKKQIGFIAEDVYEHDPLLVNKNKKGEIENIDPIGIIALLVDKLKEKDFEIKQLKSKVENIENSLNIIMKSLNL